MTLASSRTLPGHGYSASATYASGADRRAVAVAAAHVLEEVIDEQRDVLAPLAQRRHVDVDHVDPVVEVLPEQPLGHHLRQGPVRGRDHAHVDAAADAVGADLLQLARLEEAQQHALHAEAHLADLVEEDACRSSAFSSMPGLSRYAPVKLPFTWPNSSDSSSVSGRPAQLTVMNGRSGARALRVDAHRDEFLAHAALARDQDLRVRLRHALDLLLERQHGGAPAHELREAGSSHQAHSRSAGRRRPAWPGAPATTNRPPTR